MDAMTAKYLTLLPLLTALLAGLFGCAQPTDSDSGAANDTITAPVYRQIAGTSAVGRAGSWSSNCLESDCARADAEGNYLLSAVVEQSQLMWSDIPEGDGTTRRLYSRYRHQDDLTSALVNINPSTHAVLDIWSNSQQGLSLDLCASEAACTDALMASFSTGVEETIIGQLDALLGPAWPVGRDPFADVYVADPLDDELDLMHDALTFVVSSTDLTVFDNGGAALTQVPLSRLVQTVSLTSLSLTADQVSDAQNLEVQNSILDVITLQLSFAPTQAQAAPFDVSVSDRGSFSRAGGELLFVHDLTLASGTSLIFNGPAVTTTITQGGHHNWVVTATDINGFSKTQGFVIPALSGIDEPASFGGEGSCLTPVDGLTANVLNQCQEVQNGSTLGDCDQLLSGSVNLGASPVPCAREQQNGGALIGVCTLVDIELRVFQYENPLRLNNIEDFTEQQSRVADQCTSSPANLWSTTP
ncbi:hypothetical protein [Reinekea sp.]|jgi:hypothetical protein|uniref:hypothetical protein n=1 Tax=Reinekea sp. TaxID=1970455 RepID=UPI002A814D34|nr:hypothetical protein [Reinekea sp.]